ncbi:hypothetical protein A2635_05520 [Candidatus Peribacteria bacterium RIFCSPHIGHO2_01_FULL_51_9]|nr:MAG: hypothetical protein A2635_05520 [Candidatus Peribacteria bacterium RIFCSPHIGHO2_01_FULL_51_9]
MHVAKIESSVVTLRKATMADAQRLFDWRTDALTRENSISTHPVEWDGHLAWLERTIGGAAARTRPSTTSLYVAEVAESPVGTVRTEEKDGYVEISYTIAPEWRGRGLGKVMAVLCKEEYLAGKNLRALIKKGHVPSEAIAAALGLFPMFEEGSKDADDPRPIVEWR